MSFPFFFTGWALDGSGFETVSFVWVDVAVFSCFPVFHWHDASRNRQLAAASVVLRRFIEVLVDVGQYNITNVGKKNG